MSKTLIEWIDTYKDDLCNFRLYQQYIKDIYKLNKPEDNMYNNGYIRDMLLVKYNNIWDIYEDHLNNFNGTKGDILYKPTNQIVELKTVINNNIFNKAFKTLWVCSLSGKMRQVPDYICITALNITIHIKSFQISIINPKDKNSFKITTLKNRQYIYDIIPCYTYNKDISNIIKNKKDLEQIQYKVIPKNMYEVYKPFTDEINTLPNCSLEVLNNYLKKKEKTMTYVNQYNWTPEEFITAWETSNNIIEVQSKLNVTTTKILNYRANKYRKLGIPLKILTSQQYKPTVINLNSSLELIAKLRQTSLDLVKQDSNKLLNS
jgi:hypothetical protein